jgi:hypothetical protein
MGIAATHANAGVAAMAVTVRAHVTAGERGC